MAKRATLSICMIVKNEEALLGACLESIKSVADQIVVVDTGSTDDTIAIATKYGAKIYHFEWIKDFAAARNESLKHATSDWILVIDADESLDPDSVEILQEYLIPDAKPTVYRINIRNLQEDQISLTVSKTHRLFTNGYNIHFSGRVHEQVIESLLAVNGQDLESAIYFDHGGYAMDPKALEEKWTRNMELLEKQIEQNPTAYMYFTYGQQLALLKRYEDAYAALRKSLKLNYYHGASLATLLNVLGDVSRRTDRLDEAEKHGRQSLQLLPYQVTGNFLMYRVIRARGEISSQIHFLEKVERINKSIKGGKVSKLSQDISLPERHIRFTLGELYLEASMYPEASDYLGWCFKKSPDDPKIREYYGLSLGYQGGWEEALATLSPLDSPYSDKVMDMLGMIYIKLQQFDKAITHYESWLESDPDHPSVRMRLAGLYGKAGRHKDAKQLLAQNAPGASTP